MSPRLMVVVAGIALAGCNTLKSAIEIPKEVAVPVAVPCIKEPLERPAFKSDAELAALDDYRLVLELAIDRLKRIVYQGKLEAQVAGCR